MTTTITITTTNTLAEAVAFLASVHRLPVSRMWASIVAGACPSAAAQLLAISSDSIHTTATRERAGVLLGLLLDTRAWLEDDNLPAAPPSGLAGPWST